MFDYATLQPSAFSPGASEGAVKLDEHCFQTLPAAHHRDHEEES